MKHNCEKCGKKEYESGMSFDRNEKFICYRCNE